MSKEKLKGLQKYSEDLKNKLGFPTPAKHQNSPETYRQFLNRELDSVSKKIEYLKSVQTK